MAQLLSVTQAAEYLGIGPATIRASISRGRGPMEAKTEDVGGKTRRFYTKGTLKAWQKAKKTA